jgi:four helix bundle protein
MELARQVYAATEAFPKAEQFGLSLQMRRAAVSVASNIAEGAARKSSKDFANFLGIALGSLAELDTQIELAISLGWLPGGHALPDQHRRVAQLTTRLRQAITRRTAPGSRITDHGSR